MLNKEIEGLNAKEGGSTLVRAAAKMPTEGYSGTATLGTHISSKTDESRMSLTAWFFLNHK